MCSEVKSVHMKYESSPNLVSIKHQTNAPRHRMSVHQNHVYTRHFKNTTKCTIGKAWCQLSTTSGPCGLSELPCGTCVCHSEGECFEMSVSDNFL